MSRRLLLGLVLVATLPIAGSSPISSLPAPAPVISPGDLQLVAFDSCAELLTDLRAAAGRSVGPWGFSGSLHPTVLDGGARTAIPTPTNAPAPTSFSTTNTAETAADEPDLVKTDGRRIVTVRDGTLHVIDAATRKETGKTAIGVRGAGTVLLSGDHALVLTDGLSPQVLLFDLAGAPRLVSRYKGQGTLVDARQTGSVARVVLKTTPSIALPMSAVSDERRLAANRAAIAKAPLAAWLPTWSVTTGGRTTEGTVGCDRISRPASYSGTSMSTVLTFDLAAAELGDGDPVGVAADADTVYGTGSRLYLAGDQRWRLDRWPGRAIVPVAEQTSIYRFDLSGSRRPAFTTSALIPGFLVNQYALSEWDGYLRVATTASGSSAVRVLDRSLKQVGIVGGLGRGERIYSVRFLGPRGYVVTFKQTDPLYAVDLSDPARPVVSGELKINGYSAHLQPAGDGRLIGIGQEASASGRTQGTQISLFDVTNPAAPQRLAQHVVANGQSGAEWDPHALLYWPATRLLVVPVSQFSPLQDERPRESALALRVGDTGLTVIGSVAQPVVSGQAPTIRRTFVVGDVLWTLSDNGLQASSLATLSTLGRISLL